MCGVGSPAARARRVTIREAAVAEIGSSVGVAVAQGDEQRARCCSAAVQPGVQGGQGAGRGMVSGGDGDDLAAGLLVGLGAAHVQEQPAGVRLEVGQG